MTNHKLQYFNSIKVRLKPTTADTLSANGDKFQFHKGTIKTENALYPSLLGEINFNSIKVRLKHITELTVLVETLISIP